MSALPHLIEQFTGLRDWVLAEIKAALPFVRDGKLDLSSKNIVGTLPATSGGSGTNTGGEPTLGNPPGDYYVLTSTAAGTPPPCPLTAGSGKLTVTNGNGVSGNPTVDVGTLTSGDIPNNAADPTFPSYPASGFYADGVTRLNVDNVYPDASNGDIYVGGNVSGSGSTKIMRLASGGDPTGAWQDLGADTDIPTLAGNSVDLHYRGITGG